MKTVATFREAYLAYLAKGRLATEGISAIVMDEYIVGINWLYSQAVGGVKLRVPEADYERACRILQEDHAGDLETINREGSGDICPQCGSAAISVRPYSRWWLIPSLLFMVPVFFRRKNGNATVAVRYGERQPVKITCCLACGNGRMRSWGTVGKPEIMNTS